MLEGATHSLLSSDGWLLKPIGANSGLEKAPAGEAAKFVLHCVDLRPDCDPLGGKFAMVAELVMVAKTGSNAEGAVNLYDYHRGT